MISKCRSRATDGGCVLKMKLLRWPRARERRRRRRGRDCSREGKENRKVVLRLSGWARCVPRPRAHFRFNDRKRRGGSADVSSGSASSNFIIGIGKKRGGIRG